VELNLPIAVVSKVDVARVMRELNALNDYMVQVQVREPGQPTLLPRLSRLLEEVGQLNKYNLLIDEQRKELYSKLNVIIGKGPLLHVSFAAEPSGLAVQKVLQWLRANIHPQVLLQVGLQPNIAAGCVVRTPNLVFDLSLRNHLKQQEPYLVELIEGVADE
jgi:F0F1-type ATP synthase delta subunit